MGAGQLNVVEKKVLGAMLIIADDQMNVTSTNSFIANKMGYKRSGGAITFAIQALEMKNFIYVLGKGRYQVLL